MASTSELKSKIPGWGADLDLKMRPGVPREKDPERGTGAHWDQPERQEPKVKIFKSTEHKELTPVFGTSCPPKGLSGKIREFAYTYSEGKKIHWLLLLLGDRVDVIESALDSMIKLKAHNPLAEMGLRSEFRRGGFFSRFGQNRSDMRRWRKGALLFLGVGAAFALTRSDILKKSA